MTDMPQGPTSGVTAHLTFRDQRAAEAIAFYKAAFAAEEQVRMAADDGKRLMHAHLHINGGSLMLNDDFPEYHQGSYNAVPGGVTLHLQVDDADAWCARAIRAGATERMAVQDMFWGDRYGQVTDPFGYHWAIATPIAKGTALG